MIIHRRQSYSQLLAYLRIRHTFYFCEIKNVLAFRGQTVDGAIKTVDFLLRDNLV